MDQLKRKAIVTGGSQGIGAAVVHALAQAGAQVVAMGRSTENLSAFYRTLDPVLQKNIELVQCDICEDGSVRMAVEQAADKLKGVDVLINSAGVSMPEARCLDAVDHDLWRRILSTNLDGIFNMCHAVLPHMRAGKGGDIINILSTAAFNASVGNAPYTASKYGARALTETMAKEYATEGIRVSAISPGPVNTSIWTHKTNQPTEEQRKQMITAQTIADAVMFLLRLPANVVVDNITIRPIWMV